MAFERILTTISVMFQTPVFVAQVATQGEESREKSRDISAPKKVGTSRNPERIVSTLLSADPLPFSGQTLFL